MVSTAAGCANGPGQHADKGVCRCFYINLPFAVPPAIATIFIIKVPPLTGDAARSWLQKIRELDYLGIFLLLPGITVFIMALEFGVENWNDARTIGCFAAAGTLLLSFMAQQWWMGERALVPLRIMKTRVVLFGSTFTFCLESAFLVLAYYVSQYSKAATADMANYT